MKKVTFFAAAAAVTALVASPALAQDSAKKPEAAKHMKTKQMKQHQTSRHMKQHQARAYRGDRQARAVRTDEMTSRDDWNNRSTGFWPADVVGGAVGTAGAIAGTAVGTAGAIATAPFGGPAYNRGPYYSDASGYPYGNRHRYGGAYASTNYSGWNDPGYIGEYNYNGVAIPASASYDARNGFSCRPGTVTRLASGERVFCQ